MSCIRQSIEAFCVWELEDKKEKSWLIVMDSRGVSTELRVYKRNCVVKPASELLFFFGGKKETDSKAEDVTSKSNREGRIPLSIAQASGKKPVVLVSSRCRKSVL